MTKIRKKGTIEDKDGVTTIGNAATTVKTKVTAVLKGAAKKRKKTIEDIPNWTPEAIKNATEFMNKYSSMGVEGIKEEFKREVSMYRSPTYGDAAFKANAAKNRHKEPVQCLDDTRVSLPENKYINASWMYDQSKFARQYILTQAPMDSTIEDFWKMCFEHKAMCVVVLCDMKEKGEEVSSEFWPMKDGDFKNYGTMFVSNKKSEQIHKETVTTLEVLPDGCSNSLILSIVQFKTWEETFTQSTGRNLLKIIRVISRLEKIGAGPVVVIDEFSSISRAAVMTVVDVFAALIYKGEKNLLLPDIVKWARRCRNGMITNEEDYLSVIKTLFEYLYRTSKENYKEPFEKLCGKAEDLN